VSNKERPTKPPPIGDPAVGPHANHAPLGAPPKPKANDLDELSGSVLLDETVAPASGPPPAERRALAPFPKLPKPNPPPRSKSSAPPRPSLSVAPPKPGPREPPQAPDPGAPKPGADTALARSPPRRDAETHSRSSPDLETLVMPPLSESRAALPPRPVVPAAPLSDDIELTTLPRGRLQPIVAAVKRALKAAGTRLPMDSLHPPPDSPGHGRSARRIVLAGAVVTVAVVVALAATRRHSRASPGAAPSRGTGSSEGLAAPPPTAQPTSSAPSRPAPPTERSPCTLAGSPKVLAPSAIINAGIEVRAVGAEIALGFASGDHQAVLMRLDPSSLSASDPVVVESADPVRRVTPFVGRSGRLGVAVDADRGADPLQGRRTLAVDPPVQMGVAHGQLAWAHYKRGIGGALWPVAGDVDAIRGVRSDTDSSNVTVALRSAGSVWVGTAQGAGRLTPKGDLVRVASLGPSVGSPAIASTGGGVLVTWADRTSSDGPWQLRWAHFKVGESPEPHTFTPPPGGKGEQAMSPGVAVVPGGGFLLVWTEGPASAHEVRAVTLLADGSPVGRALDVSTGGTNAGQGQAAIAAGGRGVVAFLESNGDGFRVVATPIACPL
jgi:hypothetical protein